MIKKIYVTMTDKFMSNWGMAGNKINKYIVECSSLEEAVIIEKNARRRSEMKYVNICMNKPKYGKNVYETHVSYDELGDLWKR